MTELFNEAVMDEHLWYQCYAKPSTYLHDKDVITWLVTLNAIKSISF